MKQSIPDHLASSVAQNVAIAQLEGPEAVEDIDAIATVPGIDALFAGRVDLTVAYGATSLDDPHVVATVDRICAAGRKHNRRVGMFLARPQDVPPWEAKGASLFLLGSDRSFMLQGAANLLAQTQPCSSR